MAQELTYALITPYSLSKSRTGSIIGRLLTMADLELMGARLLSPSDAFVDRYIQTIEEMDMQSDLKRAFVTYVSENFRPNNPLSGSNRTLLLLFRGENAMETLKHDAVGSAVADPSGETVRGAYGDFIRGTDGEIKYFEPAVLTGTDHQTNLKQLELIARFAPTDGGVLDKVVKYPRGTEVQTTLVILKPETFGRKSTRPGNIIDMFSRTGLRIIAAKVLRMSVEQGMEFYGPLRSVFREKLKGQVLDRVKKGLKPQFPFDIPDPVFESMTDMLKEMNAEYEFARIVAYMTGVDPAEVTTATERKLPGREKCLALVYQGPDAVQKIREILGATDPSKAAPATVRSAFGQDLMRNAAHASDSPENAVRERRIVGLLDKDECAVTQVIDEYLSRASARET